MKVTREDLDWAASQGLISMDQAKALWKSLEERDADRPRFDLANVAYYLGALIVIGAMGWFMTEAWERFGGGGILLLSTVYATCFVLAGRTLWFKQDQRIPGGLFYTMAVCMTPLAIYGLERLTGIWPQGNPGSYHDYHVWVRGSWLFMEIGTIIAGLVALRFVRFPFLTAPIAFSLWYLSMDLTPLLFGRAEFTWDDRLWVSLWFGLAVLLATYLLDRRTKDDYAFWGYLFGMAAFWGGLSMIKSDSELTKFMYCLLNCALIVLSVALQRRVFLVFGSLGVFGYLGYLAHRVFQESLLFPFALSLLGVLIIYLGITYKRKRRSIEEAILTRVPSGLKRLLPTERVQR